MIPFLLRYWKPAAAICAVLLLWALVVRREHIAYQSGYAAATREVERATEALRRQVAEATARNRELAAAARAHYEVDHAQSLIAARLPVGTRELCAHSDDRRERVREAGAAHPGDEAESATAGLVQPVPTADHGLSDDRSRLLGALAAMADEQSAVIREYQAR